MVRYRAVGKTIYYIDECLADKGHRKQVLWLQEKDGKIEKIFDLPLNKTDEFADGIDVTGSKKKGLLIMACSKSPDMKYLFYLMLLKYYFLVDSNYSFQLLF